MLSKLLHGVAILALTALSQIGGVAYIIMLLFKRWSIFAPSKNRIILPLVFLAFYCALSISSSYIAPYFGRVPLSCFAEEGENLEVLSPLYCILNRHYVTPKMKNLATHLADHLNERYEGTKTIVLDGNFPFIDHFPLLPHLSHHDGKKLDLAFFYKDRDGHFLNGQTRSPLGYWAFEKPESEPCDTKKRHITMRWNVYWFQPFVSDLELEDNRMKTTLEWLNTSGRELGLKKMFIEPHLAKRYNISGGILKFQGCRAARHDDHIHIQF